MQLLLPESALPVKLTLDSEAQMSDNEYYEFCASNPGIRVERNAKGEIIIVPPAGWESDGRNLDIAAELRSWAKRDKRGRAFGPTAEYILPSGAAYSPDASWVSYERIAHLSKEQKRKFPAVVPEFIVEVMSPSDRLKAAKAKMKDWMADGVELGWLFDADNETGYICGRGQQEPEVKTGGSTLTGEGPIKGFELDLEEIWEGL